MSIKHLFIKTPVTACLLTSFIALFMVQFLTGVDANNPTTKSLIDWGANFFPLTMTTEPWRLISSGFLHIGLMHLLFNGFAMYYFGQAAEVTFGRLKFLLMFVLSVVGGNLLNSYVTWQQIGHNVNNNETVVPGVSAGASGGIMGLGMALLLAALFQYLRTRRANQHRPVNAASYNTVSVMPDQLVTSKQQLKSLTFIMVINLVYGFAVPGIDNAGHFGGAITGGIIALGILLGYRYSKQSNGNVLTTLISKMPWVIFIVIGVLFFILWQSMHQQLLQLLQPNS